MKTGRKVLFSTPTQTSPTPTVNPDAPVNNKSWKAKSLGFVGEYLPVIIAICVSFAAYFIARFLMPDNLSWWAKEVWAMIIAFIALAGVSAAMTKKMQIDSAVAWLIIMIFLFRIISGYSNHYQANDELQEAQMTKVVEVPVLKLGTTTFHLDSVGETTSWFRFPENIKVNYSIASADFGYSIIFADGREFIGDPNGILPPTQHAVVKLMANKPNQFITVTVKKITL
jgi:hypothetical protein